MMASQEEVYRQNWRKCYAVDNNFAYKKDVYDRVPSDENRRRMMADVKMFNFVPTYDPWCLTCDNKQDVTKRCGNCHSVYFCNTLCQRKAWPIHKEHCGRNLFGSCISCGKPCSTNDRGHDNDGGNNEPLPLKCDNCPAKYCSESCKALLQQAHIEFDCEIFAKRFSREA